MISNDKNSGWGGVKILSLARMQLGRIVLAAVCMGICAVATAGYAFLVGPVLKALFLGTEGAGSGPVVAPTRFLVEVADLVGKANIWTVGALIMIVATVKGLAFFSGRALVIGAGQRILVNLRAELYRGLLALNPLSPRVRARGELVSRYTVEVEMVEQAVSSGLLAMVRDGLQIAALAGLALALDPLLGLLGLVAFPLIAVVIVRIGREIRRRKREVFNAFSDIGSIVDETAAGLSVIRSFGAEHLIGKRFSKRNETLMKTAVRALILRAFSSPLNEVLGAAALAGTLFYARHRIGIGALTPEAFISFFTALVLLYQPVKGLGAAQHTVQTGLAALDRLAFLRESAATVEDKISEQVSTSPLIELQGISAGYDDKVMVLRELDLSLEPGARLAIVGPSGCGKTTLINLLCGNIPLARGNIKVDGKDIDSTSINSLGLFAPVQQEPFLFDDTILLNVKCGRAEATEEEVRLACRAAGVLDFAKLEDPVGMGGADLSVGQRQRVCLARALVSRAPVLLLDEVTASLDGETERALVDHLSDYLGERTVLVVTHRYATAAWANQLALLDDGKIRVRGNSRSLIEEDSRIIALFGRQAEKEGQVV